MNTKLDAVSKMLLVLAEREVIHLRHNLIGPAHLLLALFKMRNCNAMMLIGQIVHPDSIEGICKEVERQIGTGPDERIGGPVATSSLVDKVIEQARLEVEILRDPELGTQHILLGLLAVPGVVSTVLQRYGLCSDSIKSQMGRSEV